MSKRITRSDLKRRKRNRRLITLAWIAGLATLVIVLLLKEKADWLYLLATLGLAVLLVIVAMSDLHDRRKSNEEAASTDGPGSSGRGIPATTQRAVPAPSDWPSSKRGRK